MVDDDINILYSNLFTSLSEANFSLAVIFKPGRGRFTFVSDTEPSHE